MRKIIEQYPSAFNRTPMPTNPVYPTYKSNDFGITDYFDFIGGADFNYNRDEKWQVIEYVFENAGIKDRENALMIGDRMHDIIGAKKTGIKCLCVLCGYGDREEFNQYGADYIVETIPDIVSYIL